MQNALQSPLILPCGVTLKNRIVKSAMSENLGGRGHLPTPQLSTLYETWANGGAALLISGNIMIDSSALGEPNNVAIDLEQNADVFRSWAKAGKKNNTHLWAQLNHPGKQSPKFLSKEPVAPSAIGFPSRVNQSMFNLPRELSEKEIWECIKRFGHAAGVLKKAGFTGVQIHGAHGYLVSQFLSSRHNKRADSWGGSLENRLRFLLEIYKEIRHMVGPKFPIGVKLNSADFQTDSFSMEESMSVVKTLDKLGIDLIEVSGGTYEAPVMMGYQIPESTRKREAYFLDYAERVSNLTVAPILLTGGFRSAQAMETALTEGACQLIGLARSMAVDPNIPKHVLSNPEFQSESRQLTTGFPFLDRLVPLEITWYTQQLHRMGNGKKTDPKASEILSVLKSIADYGIKSLVRTRVS